MVNLTGETRELKYELEKSIKNLVWNLCYNYLKLETKYIHEELKIQSLLNEDCKFEIVSTNSYKLSSLSSKVITVTGDMKEDVTNLLYGLTSALTGIEDHTILVCKCQDIEDIIRPTLSLSLSDYKEEKQVSEEYKFYSDIGNPHATLQQLEEERLDQIADL